MATTWNLLSTPLARTTTFLLLQALVIAGAAAGTARYREQFQAEHALPTARPQPLKVTPKYDYPWLVSDEQLLRVLDRLKPRFRRDKPKINHIDHALRFWGVDATFDDPECLSGAELRELIVDHRKFAAAWGRSTPPLLMQRKKEVKVRTLEGNATASHVDHTLAGLAEVGTPLDFPIATSRGVATMQDLLNGSLHDFALYQTEYEWSTLAYALYIPPDQPWLSAEGQEITFDCLARRIMRQPYHMGVCFGNHRLYTLAALLQIDDQAGIISPDCRAEILIHLRDATDRLVKTQHAYGYWDRRWSGVAKDELPEGETDSLANRLLATGHALEWWAIAPPELHPPREALVRAAQWLYQQVDEMPAEKVAANYTFLSHVGRALSIWRGHEAAYFAKSLPAATKTTPSSSTENLDTLSDKP